MYILKVKRLDPAAIIPQYATPADAGLDLFSIDTVEIVIGQRVLVHTGIAIELPPQMEAQVRPRSGLALKHGITVLNTPGTIDSGYRGEIGVLLVNLGEQSFNVIKGMKIAQLVVMPVCKVNPVESDFLTDSDRGDKGFGSSGYYEV